MVRPLGSWYFYAVRKKGTNKYFPYHYRTGSTRTEVVSKGLPQLFNSIGDARRFFNNWVRGIYVSMGNYAYIEGRKRSDYEIVTVVVRLTNETTEIEDE